jgi:hypothetical protein
MKKIIFIFIISIFTNYSYAKDLSGKIIDCYKSDSGIEYHTSIEFLTSEKVKYASAINNFFEKKLLFLIPEHTFDYKVTDEKILLLPGTLNYIHDPEGKWDWVVKYTVGENGLIWINRDNLFLQDFNITVNHRIRCTLDDYKSNEVFERYKKFQNLLNNPSENKKENIL